MTDQPCTHAAGKALHLLDRKEIAYTLQTPFHKAGYRPYSVQFLNSTQDSKIWMMGMVGPLWDLCECLIECGNILQRSVRQICHFILCKKKEN